MEDEHSEPPPLRRHKGMTDRFDGEGEFGTYWKHFEMAKELNQWRDGEAKCFLAVSLAGRARDVYFSLPDDIREGPLENLKDHYQHTLEPRERPELFRAQFRTRRRRNGGKWPNVVRELTVFGSKSLPNDVRGNAVWICSLNVLQHFLTILEDKELRRQVRMKSPATLDEAMRYAATLEAIEEVDV